jgi:hypothetical protein
MDAIDSFKEQVAVNRASGIRIDRQGQFWHDNEPIEHEGFRRALFSWLDRLPDPDGRYILRLDSTRFAFLDVQDTPLVAKTLRWNAQKAFDSLIVSLTDGTEETLALDTLTYDHEGTLRALVRSRRLEARMDTAALATLAPYLKESSVGWRLELPGHSVVVIGPRGPL